MRRRLSFLLGLVAVVLALVVPSAGAHTPLKPGTSSTAGRSFMLGGKRCNLVAVPTAGPLGLLRGCEGVRPGAAVMSPIGVCSLNFMWKGSDGATYMGTAGHCVLHGTGVDEKVWPRGGGPPAADGQLRRIGEFAYAVLKDEKDFALIRLDPSVAPTASPQMCHFGGPTGVNTDRPGPLTPVLLHQFGQGLVLGAVVPGRTLVALGMPDPDHVFAQGPIDPGDSGSGVTTSDGRAVGVVVTVGLHQGNSLLDAGLVGITRFPPQLEQATRATGVRYTLQTAPLL